MRDKFERVSFALPGDKDDGLVQKHFTISRKLIRPVNCAIASVANCNHLDAVRKERPEWCCFASVSNSCLGTSSSIWEKIVLQWDMAWLFYLVQQVMRKLIIPIRPGSGRSTFSLTGQQWFNTSITPPGNRVVLLMYWFKILPNHRLRCQLQLCAIVPIPMGILYLNWLQLSS